MAQLNTLFVVICTIVALGSVQKTVHAVAVAQLIREIVQSNLVGVPTFHKVSEFEFDPDVSVKRRQQFYELHGYHADKLIERLGLGIDGKGEQRLAAQRARDEGKLQGAAYQYY